MKRHQKKFISTLLVVILAIHLFPTTRALASAENLPNAIQWADTDGNAIQAHGGGMIYTNGYYYWFGENRDDTGHFLGVSCYRSSNLVHWTYIRDVLTQNSASELNYCWIERPKVMYCAATGQFVMWMHWENGTHYGEARCAVAYCNTVDGNYAYQGSFRPLAETGIMDHDIAGYMSRDCSVFVDTDGTGYFISAANENADLMLYQLTSDYRQIDHLVAKLFAGSKREAPCLFKRGNYYFLLTSGCTGWSPNQAKYSVSASLSSGWSSLQNIGDSTTFYSQPAFVIPVQGSSTTTYLYTGDRWGGAWGGKVNESMYVWEPISFPSNTTMSMSWGNTLSIDTSSGIITSSINYFQLKNVNSNLSLDITNASTANAANVIQNTSTGANNQRWQFLYDGAGYFKLKNVNSQKVLDVSDQSTENGGNIIQYTDNGGNNQKWRFVAIGNNRYLLMSKHSGLVLDVSQASQATGSNVIQWERNQGTNQQWYIIP